MFGLTEILTALLALIVGGLGMFGMRQTAKRKDAERERDEAQAREQEWAQAYEKRKEIRDAEHFTDPGDARYWLQGGDADSGRGPE